MLADQLPNLRYQHLRKKPEGMDFGGSSELRCVILIPSSLGSLDAKPRNENVRSGANLVSTGSGPEDVHCEGYVLCMARVFYPFPPSTTEMGFTRKAKGGCKLVYSGQLLRVAAVPVAAHCCCTRRCPLELSQTFFKLFKFYSSTLNKGLDSRSKIQDSWETFASTLNPES